MKLPTFSLADLFDLVAERLQLAVIGIAMLVAIACGDSNTAPVVAASDPASAQIITADLAHFWAAYDAGGKSGSTSAFQAGYLDISTAGLRSFSTSKSVTAASLAQMVSAYPRYFASIRSSNLQLVSDPSIVARIRANFATIKGLYPPAVFPPVTLLVGRFNTGGTTTAQGMLIGSEFYSVNASTPLDELGQFQRDNVKGIDSITIIIAHEHAHVLQLGVNGIIYHSNKTLLEQSLIEGSADFIGERSSGGNINGHLWAFAIPNEAALWQDFQTAMHGTDISRWLYNQGSANATPTHPGDLGYFIGYRIAAAYYDKQADKTAALRDIIEVKDADDFLKNSGYSPQ